MRTLSSPRTIGLVLAALLVPAVFTPMMASAAANPEDQAPLVVACGTHVYQRISLAVYPASHSYFALYGDGLGGIAARWQISSEQVTTSEGGFGLTLTAGPRTAQAGGSPAEMLTFSMPSIGYYGSCAYHLGNIAADTEYHGQLQGGVVQITTETHTDCSVVQNTRFSAGVLWFWIIGVGWIRAGTEAKVVCAQDTKVDVQPDLIFDGPLDAYYGGTKTMVCYDGGAGTAHCHQEG